MPVNSSSMPSNISNNVIHFPTFGKAITLDDLGIYYAINTGAKAIHSIFQLVCQDDDWYLYQLKSVSNEEETRCSLLLGNSDCALHSITNLQIRQHFSKPEDAEPMGTW